MHCWGVSFDTSNIVPAALSTRGNYNQDTSKAPEELAKMRAQEYCVAFSAAGDPGLTAQEMGTRGCSRPRPYRGPCLLRKRLSLEKQAGTHSSRVRHSNLANSSVGTSSEIPPKSARERKARGRGGEGPCCRVERGNWRVKKRR